jgi:hypothetical protein
MFALLEYLKMITAEYDQIWTVATIGVVSCFIFLTLRTIYRLYLHPLRKVPGPKLAAASHIVEFYYDVILGGKFCKQLEVMHRKYGQKLHANTSMRFGED